MKKQRKLILTKQNLFSVPTEHRAPADHFFIL